MGLRRYNKQKQLLQTQSGGKISRQKSPLYFTRLSSECQPKVFLKTFGCPLVVAKTDYGEDSKGTGEIGMSIYFYPTD